MAIRTSRGLFLEILEPSALVNLPLEFDVYDGASPASMLATLEACFNGAYQSQISEVGSGRCSLLRSDPKATANILAKGNLVRVKTGGVYRGSWWIEEPTERLTSTQEASGEIVEVKGRGALAYLERGVVYPPVWPTEPAGYRSSSSGANATGGATTVVCSKPSGMVNTDTMIAAVAFVGGSGKAITAPPGWREIRREDEGTGLGIALFRKTVGSSEPATYSWAFTTSTQAVVNIVCLFNASPDFTVYGFAAASGGSGTAIRHPSLAVETVDGILVTFAGSTAGSGMTPPGGYTEAQDRSSDTGRKLESAYRVGPALGDTGEVTTTNTSSGTWIGMHLYVPSTASNDATFTLETMGAILGTLIDRAQSRGSLPFLTYDFTPTADSQGNPWPDTFDLTFHAGTSLLDVWRHLVSLGMEGQMTHDLRLQAFVDLSREKGSDVILRKGYHFLGDVENSGHFAELRTRFLVEGAGGRLVEVTNPTLEADPRIGRREGFLSMGTSDSPTDLARAGEQALALSVLEDASRSIPIDHGLLVDGRFEPWEEYRIGDYIGLDPDGTGIVTRERVVGITVSHREALDYNVELDLNSVSLEASVRMRRQLDALSRSSSGGGSGSSGLSLGGSGGSGGSGAGTVAVAAGDTLAFLLDKIDVRGILRKALGGVPGNRTVQLDAVIGLTDLGTGVPSAANFLRGDGAWEAPPAGGGGGGGFGPISLPLVTTYAGDTPNGVFNALGRQSGEFSNPSVIPSGLFGFQQYAVVATQINDQDGGRTAVKALDHTLDASNGCSHTQSTANAWWKANFGSGRTFTPTRLALVGRSSSGQHPRNFKLQGSNDDSSWTDLLTVTGAGPSDNTWWSAAVAGSAAYRYLRIYQTGANSSGDSYLVIGEVEMWGTLA